MIESVQWEQLALALHFESSVIELCSVIEIVKRNNFYQTEDTCREVLLTEVVGGTGRNPITI